MSAKKTLVASLIEKLKPEAPKYPRVSWLRYFIRIPEVYTFNKGLTRKGRLKHFRYELKYHDAIFIPTTSFADIESARAVLDPQLEAWYLSGLLERGPAAPSFAFHSGSVRASAAEPRQDPQPVPMPPRLTLGWGSYPPPLALEINQCVRDLADHFAAYHRSWSSVLLHAYAMITRVEAEHKGLKGAARALNISIERLRYARQLTSVRGTGGRARKFEGGLLRTPLSDAESRWLKETMEAILLRSARLATGLHPGALLNGRPKPED